MHQEHGHADPSREAHLAERGMPTMVGDVTGQLHESGRNATVANPRTKFEVDGSILEGGGQILRMATAYASLFRVPVHITNIRAGRPKPGLAAQHLESIRLVREICQGSLLNDYVRSKEITLIPARIIPGQFEADPGTAGSITMMVQASLFPLIFAGGNSVVELHGGTDNLFSPPTDFLQHVLLPSLSRMGVGIGVECTRRGFLPHGGGHMRLNVPHLVDSLKPINLSERGDVCRAEVCLYVTKSIGFAEGYIIEAVSQVLRPLALELCIEFRLAPASDEAPMSMFWVNILVATTTSALFHGSSAPKGFPDISVCDNEVVQFVEVFTIAAREACDPLARQLSSGAAVDEHLLDQLILPASLAQGMSRFLAAEPSLHAQTAIHVAKLLVPEVQINEQRCGDLCLIEITGIGYQTLACPVSPKVTLLAEEVEERRRLRELQRQSDKKIRELLHLQDNEKGVAILRAALATLASEVAPTLLHGYAVAGRMCLINTLLNSGACHVDTKRAKDGCTALHIAEYKGHKAVVDILRAHSADPSLRNKWDETPADVAAAFVAGQQAGVV